MTQHKQSHRIKWHDQHIKWHDMTCHVATNHSSSLHVTSQPRTLLHLTPQATSWHQNRSHHHHGTAEGSFTAKRWFSIGKFFLWLIVFFFETSAPGLSGHYWYLLIIFFIYYYTQYNNYNNYRYFFSCIAERARGMVGQLSRNSKAKKRWTWNYLQESFHRLRKQNKIKAKQTTPTQQTQKPKKSRWKSSQKGWNDSRPQASHFISSTL